MYGRRRQQRQGVDIADRTGLPYNAERRAPSAERRAPSAERRAPSAERRAPSAERRAPSAERRAPSAERRAPSALTASRARGQADPPSPPDRRPPRRGGGSSPHADAASAAGRLAGFACPVEPPTRRAAEALTAPWARAWRRPPSPPDRRPLRRGGRPSPETASAGRPAGFNRQVARRGLFPSAGVLAAAALLALTGALALPVAAEAQTEITLISNVGQGDPRSGTSTARRTRRDSPPARTRPGTP